jgi:hypothetical protein
MHETACIAMTLNVEGFRAIGVSARAVRLRSG